MFNNVNIWSRLAQFDLFHYRLIKITDFVSHSTLQCRFGVYDQELWLILWSHQRKNLNVATRSFRLGHQAITYYGPTCLLSFIICPVTIHYISCSYLHYPSPFKFVTFRIMQLRTDCIQSIMSFLKTLSNYFHSPSSLQLNIFSLFQVSKFIYESSLIFEKMHFQS